MERIVLNGKVHGIEPAIRKSESLEAIWMAAKRKAREHSD